MSAVSDIGTALGWPNDEVRRFLLTRREVDSGVEIVDARIAGREPERSGEIVAVACLISHPSGRTFDRIAVGLLLGGRVASAVRLDGSSAQALSDLALGLAHQVSRLRG